MAGVLTVWQILQAAGSPARQPTSHSLTVLSVPELASSR